MFNVDQVLTVMAEVVDGNEDHRQPVCVNVECNERDEPINEKPVCIAAHVMWRMMDANQWNAVCTDAPEGSIQAVQQALASAWPFTRGATEVLEAAQDVADTRGPAEAQHIEGKRHTWGEALAAARKHAAYIA